MAFVKEIMNTDYAIATTGNAGPTKDDNAEIGTVFYPCYANEVIVEKLFWPTRDKVIDRAIKSLELLKKEILKMS
jgi:nicotinamide-nucleotide amidase